MRTDPRPDDVREMVKQVLRDFGMFVARGTHLKETILVDEGRYVARSYRFRDYLAMWLVEVGLLQFYNSQGDMLATINLFKDLEGSRMAA